MKLYRDQPLSRVFAHFFPVQGDYDAHYVDIANNTVDGYDAWEFQQDRFRIKYKNKVQKLRNYLNYTFKRLVVLEAMHPGKYFQTTPEGEWISFNTGLQNRHGSDLLIIFQKNKKTSGGEYQDWVYFCCTTPSDAKYTQKFGKSVPDIAWYSSDSRDFVFDTSYELEKDVFDHLFDRAKERAGLPNANDEAVRNYLKGALENLIPKIKRNYKVAIPVYYVEEQRMQMLLPFQSASNSDEYSCFLVDRDDELKVYHLKTVYDLDQAFFAARLITRPDKDWLNP